MKADGLLILVVDDEAAIRRFLRASLSAHGHTVLEAAGGAEALELAAKRRPDIILLDLGLPDMDGNDVTRMLREWSRTPVIVLSVRDAERVKIEALDAGADDYVTKPFGMGELMARIRGVLRRSLQAGEGEPVYISNGLKVDLTRRRVVKDDCEVDLTPTEYELLKVLIQNMGRVMTHQQIIQMLWGGNYANGAHLLRVNISNLRRKIETDPTRPGHIVTEPGVGYRLHVEERAEIGS